MGLDPALIIIIAEALAVIIVLSLVVFFMFRRKSGKELAAIELFVTNLAEEKALKSRLLETILLEKCSLQAATVDIFLQKVNSVERTLLQKVIQMYLERNPALLTEIDQLIGNLGDIYCQLLSESIADAEQRGGVVFGSDSKALKMAEAQVDKQITGLEIINKQLIQQLDTATKAVDEITAEYTRVFSGNQSALELENSSKNIQRIFQDIEKRIKRTVTELDN